MWLWAKRPLWKPQPPEVNQVQLFGPLFHQEALQMARCGGNHFLPSNSHSCQWTSYSRCMWPKVHITDVSICSMRVSQVEGVYMNPTRVRVHLEANLWQTQRNLVRIGKCISTSEWKWFPMTPRYHLLELKAQEGHLVLAQKPNTFHLIMGLCSSWRCFLFLGCKWGEWDLSPFHHWDTYTYTTSNHVPIWSQGVYFYGCHVWHQQCEVPPIHIDGVWFSSHRGAGCLGYHELANMWRLGGVVECHTSKLLLYMAHWKPSCFIKDDASQELWALQ